MRVPDFHAFLSERRRPAFGGFVAVSLACFAWLVLRSHEPTYDGKPLSVWLQEAYPGGAYYVGLPTPEAVNAVSAIGADALPSLVRMVSARDTIPRRILSSFAGNYPFLHLPMRYEDSELAVWAFKVLGPKARAAVPALVRLLGDPDAFVRLNAARALSGLGPAATEAVPALIAAVCGATGSRWQDAALRDAAAAALGDIGPAAMPAIPHLAALTNVVSADLALLKIKGQSVLPFIERLKDTSDSRQWSRAARLVADLGTNAEPAVPLLLAALNTTNHLDEQALYALARVRLRPDLCIPKMIELFASRDPNIRYQSLVVLGAFGAQAKPAVPEILRLIDNSSPWQWVQWQAMILSIGWLTL